MCPIPSFPSVPTKSKVSTPQIVILKKTAIYGILIKSHVGY